MILRFHTKAQREDTKTQWNGLVPLCPPLCLCVKLFIVPVPNKKAANFGGSRSAPFSSNVILQQIAVAAFPKRPKRLLQNLVSYPIQFVSYAPNQVDFANRSRRWR